MPVTIKDIAKAAGVSHPTVSRALNGNPVISAKTTARIRQLAQEMGYTPSAVAQSLLSRRTQTIGMVITTIADPFIVRVVEGVESVAQEAGYSVFLTMSHNDPEQEMAVVRTLQRRRVDAIIVSSSRVGSLYSSQLDQIEVPIVLINSDYEGGEYLHSVAVDGKQGVEIATAHLLELGHTRIGYVGVANRPASNRQRLLGYQTALKAAGIDLKPDLIIHPEADSNLRRGSAGLLTSYLKTGEDKGQSGFYLTQGAAALAPLLEAGATGVICYNDLTAIGLLTACREQGVFVPQDLSVVGFDNIEPTIYVTPPLTTARQPRTRLGELAMNMALDLLNGQDVQDQIVTCELVIRGSTATLHQR